MTDEVGKESMLRLYLVVHDGSQAHYAHMYIIPLVG